MSRYHKDRNDKGGWKRGNALGAYSDGKIEKNLDPVYVQLATGKRPQGNAGPLKGFDGPKDKARDFARGKDK
jgi:hypothetical protein